MAGWENVRTAELRDDFYQKKKITAWRPEKCLPSHRDTHRVRFTRETPLFPSLTKGKHECHGQHCSLGLGARHFHKLSRDTSCQHVSAPALRGRHGYRILRSLGAVSFTKIREDPHSSSWLVLDSKPFQHHFLWTPAQGIHQKHVWLALENSRLWASAWWLTTICNSGSRGTDSLSWAPHLPGTCMVHRCASRHSTHTCKINK